MYLYKSPQLVIGTSVVVDRLDNKYTVRLGGRKYHLKLKESYEIGTKLSLSGRVTTYSKNTRPGGFDYYHYYLSLGIVGVITDCKISEVKPTTKFSLKEYLISAGEHLTEPLKSYYNKFFLNQNTFDNETQEVISASSMSHLIGYSGIYLVFLLKLVSLVCFWLNIKKPYQKIIEIVILTVLFLELMAFVFLRYLIYRIMSFLNLKLRLKLTRIDMISLYVVIMVLLNPFIIFNVSFQISALVIFFYTLISNTSFSSLKKILLANFVINIILIFYNNKISPLTILLTPVYLGLAVIVLLSIIFQTDLIIEGFKELLKTLNQLTNQTSLHFQDTSLVMGIIVVVLIYIIFTQIKFRRIVINLVILVSTLFMFKYQMIMYPVDKLYFLDVGQGDTAIIDLQSQNKLIVIDAFDYVGDFMKSSGYKKIDALFITHADYDHMKEVSKLFDKYLVKKVYVNYYDDFDYGLATVKLRTGDLVKCGKQTFNILGPVREYNDKNNNSLVMQTNINQKKILFTGDIEIDAENDLINFHGENLKSDVIKVPHHGSNTSSSLEFLRLVNPSHAIISVGNNTYGHPHNEVVDKYLLSGVDLFITRNVGTVAYYNNKWQKWLSIFSVF